MGEKEKKEKLGEIDSEIQSTQKDIDSIQRAIEKRKQEKESEKALDAQIKQNLELLKSLQDQKDKLNEELNKE